MCSIGGIMYLTGIETVLLSSLLKELYNFIFVGYNLLKSVHTQVTSCHVITSVLCTASDIIFYFCMYFSEKGDTRSYFYVLISYSRHDEKNEALEFQISRNLQSLQLEMPTVKIPISLAYWVAMLHLDSEFSTCYPVLH